VKNMAKYENKTELANRNDEGTEVKNTPNMKIKLNVRIGTTAVLKKNMANYETPERDAIGHYPAPSQGGGKIRKKRRL